MLKVSDFTTAVSGKVDVAGTGSGDISDKLVVVDKEAGIVANAAALKAKLSTTDASSAYKVKDTQKLFFIDSNSTDAASGDKMFYVEVSGTEITVTLVGELGSGATGAWDNANFA